MRSQRFLALALAAAGFLASTVPAAAQAGAQSPPQARGDSGRRTFDPVGRLLSRRDELKITDEQATRLEAIRTKYQEKNRTRIEQLRRERAVRDSMDRASKSGDTRRALRASMDSARTEVMAVLTPEQQAKVAEMRKHRREEWRHRNRGGKHGHHDDDDDGGRR
jgi:Spy/CpxP family protein refolding chaperone